MAALSMAHALAVQPPVPYPHRQAKSEPYAEDIKVWLEHRGNGDHPEVYDPLRPGEGLKSLRLLLKENHRGVVHHQALKGPTGRLPFKARKHAGATPSGPSTQDVDIFLRLDDIESATAEVCSRKVPGSDLKLSPKSALTNFFKNLPKNVAAQTSPGGLSRQLVKREPSSSAAVLSKRDDVDSWVVHLRVQTTAKITVNQVEGGKCELCINASEADTADSLRRKAEAQGLPAHAFDVVFNGRRLSSSKPLVSYGVSKGSVLELVPIAASVEELPPFSPPLSSPHHALFPEWQKARAGLASGRAPKLAPAGTGGSYFFMDEHGNHVAVFKPADEEPLAVNNPKGNCSTSLDGHGLRKGISPGEGAIREVAAYLLDHDHFSGVPPTALVSCERSEQGSSWFTDGKIGSLQAFINADGDCEEQGYTMFPAEEVAKIAVLDIRLANTDRNGSNILVSRNADGTVRLTPIDHGYCLPSTFQDISFEWLYWPQAQKPFNAEALRYIAKLDADADLALLAAHGLYIRPECARILRGCTLLLKEGAARGMTPFQIGSLMCREEQDGPEESTMEKLHFRASAACQGKPDPGDKLYLHALAKELDRVL